MDTVNIKFLKVFTRKPGPRKIGEGDNSGELFRAKLYPMVLDAIAQNKKIVIDLDGVLGYGTSFLEEMFGGLIRENKISYNEIKNRLTFISKEEPYLVEDINGYLLDAAKWEKQL